MGSSFSLDDLNGWVEDEYGPVKMNMPTGGPIKLLPFLRLKRDRRDALSKAINDSTAKTEQRKRELKAAGKADTELDLNASVDEVTALLRLVAEKPEDIDRFIKAVDDDGQKIVKLWEKYQKDTKLGEAGDSES